MAQPKRSDEIGTIDAPDQMQVLLGKVRVLFNQVELGDPLERIFAGISKYADTEKRCTITKDAVPYVNELYLRLARSTVSVEDTPPEEVLPLSTCKANITEAREFGSVAVSLGTAFESVRRCAGYFRGLSVSHG